MKDYLENISTTFIDIILQFDSFLLFFSLFYMLIMLMNHTEL